MSAAAPQTLGSSAPRTAIPVRTAFARVEVFGDPAQALGVWHELSPETRASFYQTEKFILTWLDIFAAREKAQPYFIVARDSAGAPQALLPLGLFRFGPLRLGQFLGGRHSNYNLGLFRADCAFSAHDMKAMLCAAAKAAPSGPHLYRFCNLPLVWRGAINPLALLRHRPSASQAYATALPEDGEAFLAKRLSAERRKKSRKKEKRLMAMGVLRYFRAGDSAEAQSILDAYFAQKGGRAEFCRSEDELDAMRAFYRSLTAIDCGVAPTVELHALALNEKIIATMATGSNGGRLQGMFISRDPAPEIAKSSPGEILLTHVLRDACARKYSSFDLGVGDAPYKTTFCDEIEPLAEALYAATWIGRLALPFFIAALAVKTAIKSHPRLFTLAVKLRARWSAIGFAAGNRRQ